MIKIEIVKTESYDRVTFFVTTPSLLDSFTEGLSVFVIKQ